MMRPARSGSIPSQAAAGEATTPAAHKTVPARMRSPLTTTPSASMPSTRLSTRTSTPSASSEVRAKADSRSLN